MSLHNGIDTMAVATHGVYTSNYGAAEQQNICNLYASWGLFEDFPVLVVTARALRGLLRLGLSLLLR